MIDFDAFLPLILPNCANAPEPLIFQALRQAAIRFCERTRTWKGRDIIETDGCDPEPIGVPNDSVLYEVAACSQGRHPLEPITLDRLAHERPHWHIEEILCEYGSRWYICPEPGTIIAIPRCSGLLHVEYVLKPSATAQSLPNFLLDQYGTDISNGTAALVLAKPDESYGNPKLAAALGGAFEMRLGALSNMGSAGQQKAKARTRARMF